MKVMNYEDHELWSSLPMKAMIYESHELWRSVYEGRDLEGCDKSIAKQLWLQKININKT